MTRLTRRFAWTRNRVESSAKVAFTPEVSSRKSGRPDQKPSPVAPSPPRCWYNKDLIGKDAVLAALNWPASRFPPIRNCSFGETDELNPFVEHEQMMPFVPFIRTPDVDAAIELAKKYGTRLEAHKHHSFAYASTRSRAWAAIMDTTLFMQNGPSTAAQQRRRGLRGFLKYRHRPAKA